MFVCPCLLPSHLSMVNSMVLTFYTEQHIIISVSVAIAKGFLKEDKVPDILLGLPIVL